MPKRDTFYATDGTPLVLLELRVRVMMANSYYFWVIKQVPDVCHTFPTAQIPTDGRRNVYETKVIRE